MYKEKLDPSWVKGRMQALGIISFSMLSGMVVDIDEEGVKIQFQRASDKDAILRKKNKLEDFEKEIGRAIIVGVR